MSGTTCYVLADDGWEETIIGLTPSHAEALALAEQAHRDSWPEVWIETVEGDPQAA